MSFGVGGGTSLGWILQLGETKSLHEVSSKELAPYLAQMILHLRFKEVVQLPTRMQLLVIRQLKELHPNSIAVAAMSGPWVYLCGGPLDDCLAHGFDHPLSEREIIELSLRNEGASVWLVRSPHDQS